MTTNFTPADAYRASLERLMRQAPVGGGERGAVAMRTGRDDRLEFTRQQTDTMTWTLADDESVRTLVEDHLFDESEQVWSALTADTHIVAATERALAGFKNELGAQFSARKARYATYRNECWALGASAKKQWFEFTASYDDWRRRAVFVDKRCTDLLRFVKDRRKQLNRAEVEGADRHTWEALTKAINSHRLSDAPDRDERLYKRLNEIEVAGKTVQQHWEKWTW